MKIEKRKICDLPMVYVTAELTLGGKRYLAAASEAPGEHAYIIDPETGDYAELWQGDTGVMNIIQIPGEERLLATVRDTLKSNPEFVTLTSSPIIDTVFAQVTKHSGVAAQSDDRTQLIIRYNGPKPQAS